MTTQFLGQIELYAFDFSPRSWQLCAGQLLPIQQNTALFSLLGTAYGGDGVRTFGLPDLRGRAAMGQGNGAGLTPRVIGEITGTMTQTLLSSEIPLHSHSLNAVSKPVIANNTDTPGPTVILAQTTARIGGTTNNMPLYVADNRPDQPMSPAEITPTGGQPHNNTMPCLVGNYCISLVGIFPTRN